jgi:DNA helicase II / ATP-dependent DNA helicase PcrA
MTSAITITSDHVFADVNHHFRITAGPGAGKTHWLVNHIKNVAKAGNRLTPCSKIGVISYTNVAVREIVCRLDTVADAVDVATIHSFLYRNVVRPYLHLLKDAPGADLVAHYLVDNHDVHFPAYDKVDAWTKAAKLPRVMADFPAGSREWLFDNLRSLTVRVDGSGNAYFAPQTPNSRFPSLAALLAPDQLLAYKHQYWREGTLAHEDVLYFAHRILHTFLLLRRFLSDRFPYLFIDEFQDTLPVQAQLVRWLADAGTTIGVIGDPEQAIFGFIDASPEHFSSFQLPGHKTYTIPGNRRSTKAIVDFLNRVRTDGLEQHHIRPDVGSAPTVYCGGFADALSHAKKSVPEGTRFLVLAWKHSTLLQARLQLGGQTTDPWEDLEKADDTRARFLNCIATALDLAQRKLFDVAVQTIVNGISSRSGFRKPIAYDGIVDLTVRRSLALAILEHLIAKCGGLMAGSAFDLYQALSTFVPMAVPGMTLPKVMTGKKFHVTATALQCQQLMNALRTPDETRSIRTIHQAKGAESPAVFVVLENTHIDHVVAPAPNQEQQRIVYVALSRAQDHLFVYCPMPSRLPEFTALGMTPITVGDAAAAATPTRRPRKLRNSVQ